MIPEVVPEQAFRELQRTAQVFHRLSNYFLPILTPCKFRVSTELQSLISYRCYYTTVRLSAQTLIVTFKATTVDHLNNVWSSKTVSGIQHKQDSTFYQRSLNLENRPHCQLAESVTNN